MGIFAPFKMMRDILLSLQIFRCIFAPYNCLIKVLGAPSNNKVKVIYPPPSPPNFMKGELIRGYLKEG